MPGPAHTLPPDPAARVRHSRHRRQHPVRGRRARDRPRLRHHGRGRRRQDASCLGYDGRLSSPSLAEATSAGLQAAGLEVLLIGLGATPMMYFAVHQLGADGGIMITGSHNPPDYNGFKMMLGTKPFYGDQIKELGLIAGGRRLHLRRRQAHPGRRVRGLYRPPRRRLSRHPAPVRGLGRRQRLGRPGHGGAGRPPARPPPAACSPRSTATSPTTTPTRPSRTIWRT